MWGCYHLVDQPKGMTFHSKCPWLKLAELTSKVETLERNLDALSSLDKIVNTLLQLDPTKINLILDIVKNIDQKV
jgi:hypothetical protein